MANTRPGYIFPNIPSKWSQEERNFALALRQLFDNLFVVTRGLGTNYDKDSYDSLKNKPSINNTVLSGNRSLSDIGIHNASADSAGLMSAALYTKLDGIGDVSGDAAGLMTVVLFSKLSGIADGATNTTECRPEVDYLSMMAEIPIPTDTSDKVEKVGGYYEAEVWNKQMVWDAVSKTWITAQDYEDITGEPFPVTRP